MSAEFPTTARGLEAAISAYTNAKNNLTRTAETSSREWDMALMDAAIQRFFLVEGYSGEGRGSYFGKGEPREVRVVGPWRKE